MKHTGTVRWLNFFALLLAFPTAYFMIISFLKFEMNVNGPFDAMAPFLEKAGIGESIGWNINILILFGPVLAGLIALAQVVNFEMDMSKQSYHFNFTIKKKWMPITIGVFSAILMGILFIYGIGENCNCH